MQLSEKIILRRYNALANDWTPLSRKPCWLSIAFHCLRDYVKRNRFSWFQRLVTSSKNYPTHHKISFASDKSFADDLVASGYCKCESNLCVTIHWDFCRVPSICSSLIQLLNSSCGYRLRYSLWWACTRFFFVHSPQVARCIVLPGMSSPHLHNSHTR